MFIKKSPVQNGETRLLHFFDITYTIDPRPSKNHAYGDTRYTLYSVHVHHESVPSAIRPRRRRDSIRRIAAQAATALANRVFLKLLQQRLSAANCAKSNASNMIIINNRKRVMQMRVCARHILRVRRRGYVFGTAVHRGRY